MEKIVLDTNVYVSAIVIGGTCEEILRRAREEEYELYVSPPILEELSNVLTRKFHWTGEQIATILEDFTTFIQLVNPRKRLRVVIEDDPDNRILECAVAADASCIVTGDTRHLLPLKSYHRILILSPSEFLRKQTTKRGE